MTEESPLYPTFVVKTPVMVVSLCFSFSSLFIQFLTTNIKTDQTLARTEILLSLCVGCSFSGMFSAVTLPPLVHNNPRKF